MENNAKNKCLYILTGGPSCGKSTQIESLRKRGFCTLTETAREVIERNGFPIDAKQIEFFQKELFNLQLYRENELKSDISFLDRGLGDSHAYCKYHLNFIPKEIEYFDLSKRYTKVFILDRLKFVNDGIRLEKNENEALLIHNHIIRSYENLGYKPIFVPVLDIEQRTDFILRNI